MLSENFFESIDNFFENCGETIENFFEGFPLFMQLTISFILSVIFIIIGCSLQKRSKKITGYIFVGLGIVAVAWKIIEILH